MAKRASSRSEAHDTAGATPDTPKPRRARPTKATEPVPPGAQLPASETQAIAAEADDPRAVATDPGPRPESLDALTYESTSMASEPSEHDIRLRAYQRYLERGGGHGQAFEDWVEAEKELRTRR
jgi:Protein of unknown function (DUF2934)